MALDFGKWKVVELKAELKKRGLPQTGLKPALVERLRVAEAQAQQTPEETVSSVAKAQAGQASSTNRKDLTPVPSSSEEHVKDVSAVQQASHDLLPGEQQSAQKAPVEQKSFHLPAAISDVKATDPVPSIEPVAIHESIQPGPSELNLQIHYDQTPGGGEIAMAVDIDRSVIAEPNASPEEGVATSVIDDLQGDARKRKRRSKSPTPSAEDVTQKRLKQDDERLHVILQEDCQLPDAPKRVQAEIPCEESAVAQEEALQHPEKSAEANSSQQERPHIKLKDDGQLPDAPEGVVVEISGPEELALAQQVALQQPEPTEDVDSHQEDVSHPNPNDDGQLSDAPGVGTPTASQPEILQDEQKEDFHMQDATEDADVASQQLDAPGDHAAESTAISNDRDATLDEAEQRGMVSEAVPTSTLSSPDEVEPISEQVPLADAAATDAKHHAQEHIPTSATAADNVSPSRRSPFPTTHSSRGPKDGRFKGLVSGRTDEKSATVQNSSGDRVVARSLHPATSALYIRELMRPLHPTALKDHLLALATPPNSSADPDLITDFYIDSIRTHCLIGFANVSAASRVRSAIHQAVWPKERSRKPLWADFIPPEKVQEWIETEKNTASAVGGRGSNKRWEISYHDDDARERNEEGRGVRAILKEVGSSGPGGSITGQGRGLQGAPLGPRRTDTDRRPVGQPSQPPSQRAALSQPSGSGFTALDSLFPSTTAKPKLYYLPVSKSMVDRRLEQFAKHTSSRNGHPRGHRGGGGSSGYGEELRRYNFEDGDRLVDQGPDHGVGGGGGGGGDGSRNPRDHGPPYRPVENSWQRRRYDRGPPPSSFRRDRW